MVEKKNPTLSLNFPNSNSENRHLPPDAGALHAGVRVPLPGLVYAVREREKREKKKKKREEEDEERKRRAFDLLSLAFEEVNFFARSFTLRLRAQLARKRKKGEEDSTSSLSSAQRRKEEEEDSTFSLSAPSLALASSRSAPLRGGGGRVHFFRFAAPLAFEGRNLSTSSSASPPSSVSQPKKHKTRK